MNELLLHCMLLVSYTQQYFNTSITILINRVWKLLIALFKVPNTGAFTVPVSSLIRNLWLWKDEKSHGCSPLVSMHSGRRARITLSWRSGWADWRPSWPGPRTGPRSLPGSRWRTRISRPGSIGGRPSVETSPAGQSKNGSIGLFGWYSTKFWALVHKSCHYFRSIHTHWKSVIWIAIQIALIFLCVHTGK